MNNNIEFDTFFLDPVADSYGRNIVDPYYCDRIEGSKFIFKPSSDLKLPKDFDREKDLPSTITDSIVTILRQDQSFILKLISCWKKYRDYPNPNWWSDKECDTSYGTIILAYDYHPEFIAFKKDLHDVIEIEP